MGLIFWYEKNDFLISENTNNFEIINIFWYHKFELISKWYQKNKLVIDIKNHFFLYIKNSEFFYMTVLYQKWFSDIKNSISENDFLILKNWIYFLISRVRFLDIRKSHIFISQIRILNQKMVFWYQTSIFWLRIIFDVKNWNYWYQ